MNWSVPVQAPPEPFMHAKLAASCVSVAQHDPEGTAHASSPHGILPEGRVPSVCTVSPPSSVEMDASAEVSWT
jgi:hypothetical protein